LHGKNEGINSDMLREAQRDMEAQMGNHDALSADEVTIIHGDFLYSYFEHKGGGIDMNACRCIGHEIEDSQRRADTLGGCLHA